MTYEYDDELDEFTNALLEHNQQVWDAIREREIQLANDLYEHSAE